MLFQVSLHIGCTPFGPARAYCLLHSSKGVETHPNGVHLRRYDMKSVSADNSTAVDGEVAVLIFSLMFLKDLFQLHYNPSLQVDIHGM